MKTINVTFEDEEIKTLEKAKGKMSWHDFIIRSALDKELSKGRIGG